MDYVQALSCIYDVDELQKYIDNRDTILARLSRTLDEREFTEVSNKLEEIIEEVASKGITKYIVQNIVNNLSGILFEDNLKAIEDNKELYPPIVEENSYGDVLFYSDKRRELIFYKEKNSNLALPLLDADQRDTSTKTMVALIKQREVSVDTVRQFQKVLNDSMEKPTVFLLKDKKPFKVDYNLNYVVALDNSRDTSIKVNNKGKGL